MRRRMLWYAAALAAALAPVAAQEGHPLVGSWHGNWGPNPRDRIDITVVMDWDGKNVTGLLNPGPDSAPLQNARLEPAGWAVHFEADLKDKSGKTVRAMADGNIQDVTSPRRSIVGTWVEGSIKGDFKLTRDN
jgi:hypothetical protein